tara:strand:- start:842 stop:1456 length:615 start_codon:yes stop_codon:yes gene_type:complete
MKNNSNKIILDLCGGTGSWSRPYKDAGYDVRVITHPEFDLFTWDDYWHFIDKVYGILCAPTCTQFSLARTTAKTPRNLIGGYRLVKRCLEIVENCRIHGNLKFWALENPVGYLRQLLGKPPLTFNPSDYGANYTKKTDLWGYYNFPKKAPRKMTEEEIAKCSINNRDLPKLPKDYVLPDNFRSQQARRSMTDEHFAQAFYKANK